MSCDRSLLLGNRFFSVFFILLTNHMRVVSEVSSLRFLPMSLRKQIGKGLDSDVAIGVGIARPRVLIRTGGPAPGVRAGPRGATRLRPFNIAEPLTPH